MLVINMKVNKRIKYLKEKQDMFLFVKNYSFNFNISIMEIFVF